MTTLPEWLGWVVGGGAGVIAFGVLALVEKYVDGWSKIPSEFRRYISFALAAALGAAGFWGQVQLGYKAAPETATAWIEALFSVIVSQVIHARLRLSRR
jgi:hypothetical protein